MGSRITSSDTMVPELVTADDLREILAFIGP
jgi:hypothetical protein